MYCDKKFCEEQKMLEHFSACRQPLFYCKRFFSPQCNTCSAAPVKWGCCLSPTAKIGSSESFKQELVLIGLLQLCLDQRMFEHQFLGPLLYCQNTFRWDNQKLFSQFLASGIQHFLFPNARNAFDDSPKAKRVSQLKFLIAKTGKRP